MAWSDDLIKTSLLYILDIVATSLSFLGSSLMLYFCFKTNPKSISIKLLFSIATCDLIYSITNIISIFESSHNDLLCHSEAFMREFSLFSSMFMATSMAIICYKVSNLEKSTNLDKFFKMSIIICIVIGLALSFAPFYIPQLSYQHETLLCWISANPDYQTSNAQLIAVIFQVSPIVLGIIVTSIGYILTIQRIKRLPEVLIHKLGQNIYRLLWYPAVLFITYIPGLVDICLQITNVPNIPTWIQALHLLLTHSIGFSNAIVYGVQTNLFRCTGGSRSGQDSPSSDSQESRRSTHTGLSLQLQIAHAADLSSTSS